MTTTSNVGISPVLLQAISQSLSSAKSKTSSSVSKIANSMAAMSDRGASPNGRHTTGQDSDYIVSQLLEQQEQLKLLGHAGQRESIKSKLKMKVASNTSVLKYNPHEMDTSEGVNVSSTILSDLAMANVLTALASQSGKGSTNLVDTSQLRSYGSLKIEPHSVGTSRQEPGEIETTQSAVSSPSFNFTIIKSDSSSDRESFISQSKHSDYIIIPRDTSLDVNPSFDGDQVSSAQIQRPQVLKKTALSSVSGNLSQISNNPSGQVMLMDDSNSVPSTPETPETLIQNMTPSRIRIIEHNGKRYIIQMQDIESDSSQSQTDASGDRGDCETDEPALQFSNLLEQAVVNVMSQQQEIPPRFLGQQCPVCCDSISGFHYGIFTCESCKGFFKRTVQNKKTFVCPRQGECEINLENRKKCPACRFSKCLIMGMKLEAIRQDRTRGGRSSYGGSSPHDEPKKKRPIKIIPQPRPSPAQSSESTLANVLNSSTSQGDRAPIVPPILAEIMSLESFLSDDDLPDNISMEDFSLANPGVFVNLLQLCELKLYKIVRWARNLSYFANVSTDDQILLLQNCWCELLALTMCWKSMNLSNEVVFFHGQSIDLEKAQMLNLGEMFSKMLLVVEQFKRLRLDQYECVALKVIILICPDIKGLSEDLKLAEQQQKVSIALEQYVSSHYRNQPNKYGEVLLRLPELSRISCMMKDQLMTWMPSNTTSCGLLYELLKGENMKELA
ncbi:nuclear hormone receptor FTZ-F1 beta-like [Dreissena polymorpha]|uniref:Uncharacterized protein n=1 Tax=Dreissena polymorpha TaxID=45954 RepID=A0A9D4FPI4_DREPO|nr:nuclear hormone receptor FTZ-F1 beta-like [Dreissena polymorpha]XP_052223669.1 nuclear hormone receptor FTZ-F1 beta-like [Dreissena polymorpha]XP_052223670.1 nuclear hormone receptor FTZ-F1 beta-like [Dreissena polymorpha]KAH3801826.1 hypothetical protein DPMN_155488 [Dreissena polymorpha]